MAKTGNLTPKNGHLIPTWNRNISLLLLFCDCVKSREQSCRCPNAKCPEYGGGCLWNVHSRNVERFLAPVSGNFQQFAQLWWAAGGAANALRANQHTSPLVAFTHQCFSVRLTQFRQLISNIARGTTDPDIDSVSRVISTAEMKTTSAALPWIALLAIGIISCIELVSSSARVTIVGRIYPIPIYKFN